MKIDSTQFGSIIIDGEGYDHDVVIRLSGAVKKRKKKLSKRLFGTSHTVSADEARHVYEDGSETLIVGTGQYGALELSQEAEAFLREKGCAVIAAPTPQAIERFNQTQGRKIGLFHVTC